MKRLFVGGLGHTVSEKDLRDRFGKFGDVSDVEIKTRKDENGSPLKTFAYININFSDSDYKRCMSILNKSKWKGGTIQIELAKESFLHRLAEERQQAAERVHTPKTDPQENIVEAFKAAGVENFHMKAAVPGTEVPGHKNWVVSKFGRVLPVLHLGCQRKSKIFKYDPSKHCHNIKKLDSEEVFTPVSKLTWEIDGGYDEISKKRRGEFPPQKKYLKKAKKDLPISTISCGISKVTTNENRTLTLRDDLSSKVKQKPLEKKYLSFFHSDADSEDEIRMLVAQELSDKQKLPADIEVDDDNLEVVGDDFVVKSDMFWGEDNGVKSQLLLKSSKNDEDYDSADTDEILTQNKNPGKREDPIKSDVVNEHSFVKSSKAKKVKKNTVGGKQELGSIGLENSDKSSKSINSDYDAMMGTCEPLDLSLAASQSLVKHAEETSDVEEHDVSLTEQQVGPSELSNSLPISETKSLSTPSKKSGNNPEDILAFLFGPDIEKEKTKTVKSSLPAFVGTNDLFASTSEPSGSSLKRPAEKINCEARDEPKRVKEAAKTSPKKNALEERSKGQLSKTSHQEHSSTCEDPEQSTLMKDMDDSEDSSSESIDSDYEAMMGNCQRLDLSLADLESLVNNANEISDDDETSDDEESDVSVSEPQAGPSELPKSLSFSKTNSPSTSSKKSGNNPEDIVAFLLEPDVEKEEKTKTMKSSLPAFVGTKDLFGSTSEPSGFRLKTPAEKIDCEAREDPKRLKEDSKTKKSAIADRRKGQLSADFSACGDPEQFTCSDKVENIQNSSSSSEFSSSIDEMESCNVNSFSGTAEKNITSASKASRMTKLADESALPTSEAYSSSNTSTEDSETSDEEEEAALKVSKVATSKVLSNSKHFQKSVTDTVKQQQDNQKRLAALEQRQKETEEQKKLIQGALSKLDVPNANKGKHIVFDSDDEVSDDEENTTPKKKSLFEEDSQSEEEDAGSVGAEKQRKEKDFEKAGGSKLFGSSEDEDDEDAEEDRFQIKPQFEGKAGQKLLELQSRFGTDPRFQMDAKFLENDDEAEEQDAESQVPEQEELIEEKKKNLAILQSVLNISIQPSDTSKEAAKGKTFRDISTLHYDPTSEAHAAFETKREPAKKESKAARRKKREEAQKLPEVSKEIYYNVAVDLKEVFGASKESQNEKKEEPSWDKVDDEKDEAEEQEETPMFSFSSSVETGKEASSGFKFSFLGVDATTEKTSKTEEYKIETLKGAKVSWQTDPRFQDSSSEDDDDDDEDENKDQSASTSAATEEPAPTKVFFFFYDGDLRLKEGPRLFCRRQKLEEQKDAWEERRTQLRQAYRKRHKDAKRRQKAENN